jgi:WD40 repeat protein
LRPACGHLLKKPLWDEENSMQKLTLMVMILAGILSACGPTISYTSISTTSPNLSSVVAPDDTRTPFPTKPPVQATAGPATILPHQPVQLSSTLTTSSTEKVDLPVLAPNLRIGKGSPTSLAVSSDGRWMAVGTQFGVYQYHADTFEQAWFTPLPEKAGPLAFDPHSKRLGVSTGNAIEILDVETGGPLTRLEGAGSSFAWSPDGQRLVASGGCEQVTVWDVSRGAALKELRGGKCSEGYSGIHVTWGADGRIYAATMGTKILAWNGDTYTPIEGFSAEGAKDTWVSALQAAPQGNLLAQYDSMGYPIVAIIDAKQDRQLHLLDQQVNGPITTLAWAPDGQHLAVAYGMNTGLTLVWNAQTGQVEQKIEGFYAAAGLGWSPDGQTLFGLQSIDGQIHAVSVGAGLSPAPSGHVLRNLGGHEPAGTFLTWTQDGLASANGVTLTWWDPDNGQALRQETVGSPQAWVVSWPPGSPGTYLYSATQGAHQVGSVASRQPLAGDEGQYPFPTAWSWDGSRLASPTQVWDARTGELLARLYDPAQQHAPDGVAWSPDGSRLVSADSLDMQSPVIWDASTGDVLLTLQAKTGALKPLWLGLAWSPDGKHVAVVGSLMHPDTGEDEGMILVWDAKTGQQEKLLTAGMHASRLWTIAWSPDGRFLACGTTGSDLFLWDMVHDASLARLQGHTDISDQLAWSPDGSRLASVARDGTLQVWDLTSIPALEGEVQR